MEMWEAQDLSGADKVNLMSAADRIPITGFTGNSNPLTGQRVYTVYFHQHAPRISRRPKNAFTDFQSNRSSVWCCLLNEVIGIWQYVMCHISDFHRCGPTLSGSVKAHVIKWRIAKSHTVTEVPVWPWPYPILSQNYWSSSGYQR